MKAIVICPDPELRSAFERAAAGHPALRILKSLNFYPSADQIGHLVRMWDPNLVFISMENAESAARLNQAFDSSFGSIQRIALSTHEDPSALRLALQLRMMELLAPPFEQGSVREVLTRVLDYLDQHPQKKTNAGQIYAFMPAKGGVGASTIAANAIRAFAEVPESRALLADFDVSSGVAGFMFNADHDYSVNDAAVRNKELDDVTWQRLVKKSGNLDLLLSGAPRFDEGIAPDQIPPILDFARRSYSVIGADLSDTLDERTLVVLREANRIFLVTTPDLPSLRLARLKAIFLRNMEWEDKTRLLVNRTTKRMELSLEEIETTVGLQVFASFPCNYHDVAQSIRKGESSPKLAASIRQFVEKVSEKKAPEQKRVRFIERFAVVPGRYGFR